MAQRQSDIPRMESPLCSADPKRFSCRDENCCRFPPEDGSQKKRFIHPTLPQISSVPRPDRPLPPLNLQIVNFSRNNKKKKKTQLATGKKNVKEGKKKTTFTLVKNNILTTQGIARKTIFQQKRTPTHQIKNIVTLRLTEIITLSHSKSPKK